MGETENCRQEQRIMRQAIVGKNKELWKTGNSGKGDGDLWERQEIVRKTEL